MIFRNFNVHAESRFYSHSIAIHIYRRLHDDDRVELLSGLQFTTHAANETTEPTEALILPIEVAQELVDALWQCGLRPSEGSGSAGALRATEAHLKDTQEFSRRLLSIVESRLLPPTKKP
jgi:hypothetical protein